MDCEKCGSEIQDGKKFCTNCGAPAGRGGDESPTVQMQPVSGAAPPQPTTQMQPVPMVPPAPPAAPVVPPGAAPYQPLAASPKPKKSKAAVIALVVIAALVVIGAAVAGIVLWRVAVSNRLVASVQSIDLTRSNGRDLDLKKVPLDETLVLEASYRSQFKQGGKGVLRMTVTDSEDNEVIRDSFTVKSSGKMQKKDVKFHMTQSSGKPLTARASLEVSKDQKKATGAQSLSYTAVAGKGKELLLQEAKDAATKKLDEATAAVKEITDMGVDTTDLVDMLSDAVNKLDGAKTAGQANEAGSIADSVINECSIRKTSMAEAQSREADIAAAKQVMFDYADAEKGNTESISLVDFSMNDARTQATATYSGMVTVHTDPTNAGMTNYFYLTADKQGGQWVVTDFRYEHVL